MAISRTLFATLIGIAVIALCIYTVRLFRMTRSYSRYRRISSMLYPLGQIVLIVIASVLDYYADYDTGYRMLVIVCAYAFVVYDLTMFRQIAVAEDEAHASERSRLLEEQVAAQQLQLARVQNELVAAPHVRAMMAQRLERIEQALKADDAEGARAELHDATKSLKNTPNPLCENMYADAILGAKRAVCEELDIPVVLDVELPADVGIPDVELCAILSNTLDNAINATQALPAENRHIEVHARVYAGTVAISVENTSDSTGKEDNGGEKERAPRQLKGLTSHGWGLEIVKTLAARHDGDVRIEQADGRFLIEVLMLASREPATNANGQSSTTSREPVARAPMQEEPSEDRNTA